MTKDEKLEIVRDFLYVNGFVFKFMEWIALQGLPDTDEIDFEEWLADF